MIREIESFLDEHDCSQLINDSCDLLTPSLVQFGQVRRESELRVSENYRWREDSPTTLQLREKVAKLCDVSLESVEPVDVVHYPPAGYFRRHHDGDFRSHTVVVALSDDYRGGRLVFPDLRQAFKPKRGDAVLWTNEADESHCCEVVDSGDKWIAVVWVRKELQQ
jgi:predicted 2-oxoglutarate/Fe(II)-dependent dioxygenase YbiX